MKETVTQIIKQSMDKCTMEQFWVVATTIGINSFLISNVENYRSNTYLLGTFLIFSTALTFYAIFIVIHRAITHVNHAYVLYKLIQSADDIEETIKKVFKSSGKFRLSD